jgi:hypothetical protein
VRAQILKNTASHCERDEKIPIMLQEFSHYSNIRTASINQERMRLNAISFLY